MKKLLSIGLLLAYGAASVSAASCVTHEFTNEDGQVYAGKVCTKGDLKLAEAGYFLKDALVKIGSDASELKANKVSSPAMLGLGAAVGALVGAAAGAIEKEIAPPQPPPFQNHDG